MKRQNFNQRGEKEDGFAKQPRRLSSEVAVKMAERPGSPSPSCLSLKSNASMDCAYVFSQGETSRGKRVEMVSPNPSSASYIAMKSDNSVEFNQDEKAQRPASPAPSCLSMKSNASMDCAYVFSQGDKSSRKRIETERPCSSSANYVSGESGRTVEINWDEKVERQDLPGPSCVSMKSNASMDCAYVFSRKRQISKKRVEIKRLVSPSLSHVFEEINQDEKMSGEMLLKNKCYTTGAKFSQELDTVSLLEQTLNKVDKNKFMSYLCQNYPECFETPQVICDIHEVSKVILERFGSEVALKIAIKVLLENERNLKTIQDHLKYKLQRHLKSKFERINEGNSQQGNPILLNDIYTELLITEGGDEGINKEHEVRLIEEACKNGDTQETVIQCNDIFKPLHGQKKRIRTVLTKGIAGIGKTVSVHKFILDWTEGKENQDIHFIFPLPFRDLNLKRDNKYSVIQLLSQYFPELKEFIPVSCEELKTLFIFDGLDECRLPLDFMNNEMCCDVTKEISVDVMLTNLIRGNLLPSALLWITSRPAAACQVPPECTDRVTEVRGFNDSEKVRYFRKRFGDTSLADKIVAHVKSSRSLHIMCHIPVFCWISATVLEKMLGKADMEVPKTLTQMYTHFLLIQTHLKNKKYHGVIKEDMDLTESDKEMILRLAKLAFLQLEKRNLIFYQEDLVECGINVAEASEYSAICTEIFKEEFGLYREKVFCFVHLSIQEHLAAVYVLVEFVNNNTNILRKDAENQRTTKISDLHKSAIDRAMQSENGHFDLFLRFLLGLSTDSNQVLLKALLPKSCSESLEETAEYIKERIRKESSAERTINLFHCLNELNYNSLVEEIRSFLSSGRHSETELKPDQCSALAYVLLTSEEVIHEFDVKMCNTSLEGYQRLLPVVRISRKAILAGINLTDESCETLASILQSANSHLRELDLSFNNLGDLGVKFLCNGLSDPHNKLEKLNLSYNNLEHAGVKLLCDCLMSPNCKLQALGLAGTNFSEQSCELMASYFQSANSHLKELDLGCNNMRDSGVKLLTAGLISLQCHLEKLGLDRCDLTHNSCKALKAVLQSSNSYLRELNLSYNKLGVLGIQQLCEGLMHPDCKLEGLNLGLVDVGISMDASETLALALKSANLRELDLSNNCIGDSGVKLICDGLISPKSKLEKLSLRWCNLTDRSCENLATVLSTSTCLTDLELRDNDLHDSGVKQLCTGLKHPHCTLQRLGLSGCCVTEEGGSVLASALSSDQSQLKELDLSYNHLAEAGLRQLSAICDDPLCKLENLCLDHCEACRIKPGLNKYAREITLDPNTAHRTLSLTGNKVVTKAKGEQSHPDHPDRFEYYCQVLCKETLIGARCYWEVEWTGDVVYIGVTYKGINRKGRGIDCKLAMNNKSWILFCSNDYGYYVSYNSKETVLPSPPNPSKRMGIYLDWNAGTLSYFIISAGSLYHMYTFHTTFTEPLYPAISVYNYNDTVTLCEIV
ncbi:NACHT, LRR and PYD domains-containing protein 3-like isoform X1 [Tachysurus fulvidraco]|uniref:NACHT, LRR and PYD domains-containing protein 3-like isoform X1 n=3 Tax=Tachysurus fulvidraco TaxID=1234273 RepID=UPI001FF0023C|nr:NACHT, LRR and PYD domains-containing protein 3-like isoform X1 [Tachysurus fulvidraco]XP_047664738.1 NACHT, LRR and PYD domains-containing protein 3-like isoform X1 [Tachysurus fulvidraco]XP_047664739.1 NACHT, LRR and PYD domains-containing protein 3-like isoform X1 [Tachysurus fulvidraco]